VDYTEDEVAAEVRGLATKILDELASHAVLSRLPPGAWPEAAWRALGEAGLLSMVDDVAGPGAPMPSLPAVAALWEACGASGAALPVDTLVVGALFPELVGEHAALAIEDPLEIHERTCFSAGLLRGVKSAVPFARAASSFVVCAMDSDGPCVVRVRASAASIDEQHGTYVIPLGRVTFDDAPGARIGGPAHHDALLRLTWLAQAAVMSGAAHRALALTADHARTREQFGAPIGTFQAVSQRIADMWIDARSMRLTLDQAVYEVSAGHDAGRAVDIARFVAGDAGHRVMAGAQHIHGGIGFDRDHPLHRLFLTFKHHEFAAGGAAPRRLAAFASRRAHASR
jgi:alkylation response protein AidB-like acyl-CoA dehydrogenase